MSREIGYYWIRQSEQSPWSVGYWTMGMWVVGVVIVHPVEIDECRIVRDETRRGARKSEKAKRNLYITTVVLRGDRMTDVAKLHGITPTCVRYIVHRTLQRRNPALFKKLTLYRPRQATPSIGDLATHAAEFGFRLQAEVGDGQKQ